MRKVTHPDLHELNDWPFYGPKNPAIAHLVERLAFSYGLRIREIEALIVQSLEKRLKHEEGQVRHRSETGP